MYKKIIILLLSLCATGFFGLTDEEKHININLHKEDMLDGLKNMDDLFNMTKEFYNDPDMADIFLEAYFNNFDFPDLEKDLSIVLDEKTYKERKEAYRAIRSKKYLLSATTVKFSKYAVIGEYPTGGFLSKTDYNKDTEEFTKNWEKLDLWSKYRWRIQGKIHSSSMIIVDGSIRLEMPRKDAKNLTGDHLLLKIKKATFMAVFRIKERGKDYLLIEPVRYMIIWRKKGKVYTNFDDPFDGKKKAEEPKNEDEENDTDY
ncbi:MAG TPA: hypothetical protein PK926_08060 [Spirochaetota bacterium]|nr:hypothetical protein [Spirochaetota bacterium]HPI88537.1 hypothetical protein [Spirochaetota bacterium]HPR48017.1 hypothetical protein [Spirochaetota bacterium]